MLLTCRSTVRSLITSSSAIARLVRPAGDQPEDLDLARAQATGAGGAAPAAGQLGRDAARSGLRPGSRTPSRAARTRAPRVVVAERPAGQADQDPDPGGLVRRIELVPAASTPAQHAQAPRASPVGQPDRAVGLARPSRRSSGAPDVAAIADQLVGGRPARLPCRRPRARSRRTARAAERGRCRAASSSARRIEPPRPRPLALCRAAAAQPGSGRRPQRLASRYVASASRTRRAVDGARPAGSAPRRRPARRWPGQPARARCASRRRSCQSPWNRISSAR